MSSALDRSSFLFGQNAGFIADLHARYLADPRSVDAEWAGFFRELDDDARSVSAEMDGASWTPRDDAAATPVDPAPGVAGSGSRALEAEKDPERVRAAILDTIRARMIIRVYRIRGHMLAEFDPLRLNKPAGHPELDPASYGFGPEDWDRPIFIDYSLGLESATLRQIMRILTRTYCGRIGVEFMHIQDPEEKAWIQEHMESRRNQPIFSMEARRAILGRLTAAECFERFLQQKYTGTKRFGLEGGESLIPALEQIAKRGARLGVKEIVLGMAHRGRLNVLANFVGKPFSAIFSEFQGNPSTPDEVAGSGDVKYHLGTSKDRDFNGDVVHLSLTANPSHLEWVNPVVVGKVRAKQQQRGDTERDSVLAVLLHGDAAVAGQGIVAETLGLSELRGYRVGGTVHVVINNQIGFTTNPTYSRSGIYCSDVAKMVMAPIFHVNGDDPEAVVHVARTAIEYRQKFKRDVFVDIVCYRRHGHNEGDEPAFTQPIMYRRIREHPTTRQVYAARLVAEDIISQADADRLVDETMAGLERDFEAAAGFRPNKADWLEGRWAGLTPAPVDETRRAETGVAIETLRAIGTKLCDVPPSFAVNPKIARQLEARRVAIDTGEGIDWATAESLAFGSLVAEGNGVRLSGQDSGRGTFSHRHAILYDQESEAKYVPLQHVAPTQAPFEVHDSPLSEAAVLGFEYGWSLAEPDWLVLWEAQFGDFANTAQTIIDQFICPGESKWLRMSGLVLLLPHGYEGQGPEHSSARVERYLQMSAEDNWQVVNCTTPANYFHALRRQMRRDFRKPLVVFSPKSLLRHRQAVSNLTDMATGTGFHRVLPETDGGLVPDAAVRRVVLCSGKVYFDLWAERRARGIDNVVLIRLEQLYPFPRMALATELNRYPGAEVVWCQEEPENQGAWTFVDRRIEDCLNLVGRAPARPRYVGRAGAASTATGLLKRHNIEQTRLVDAALTVT